MVDVGDKAATRRKAVAAGRVTLSADAFEQLEGDSLGKGDVLAAARIAGIMAAKRTSELIPLCHQVALTSVTIELIPEHSSNSVIIEATAIAMDQTGVEMEALTGVSIAALTIYDMLKSVDRSIRIEGIELVEKEGGMSGHYTRPIRVVQKSGPILPPPAYISSTNQGSVQDVPVPPIFESETRRDELPTPSPESVAMANLVQQLDPTDERLADFLLKAPLSSAYMLGDLDGPYAEHCQWYGLEDSDLAAVLLLYSGLSMPAVLTKGDPSDIEALLAAAKDDLPRRFYAHIRDEHRRPVECFYRLTEIKPMLRMALQKKDYSPLETEKAEVLSHRDTGDIMMLYQHYPDNFFEPAQLDTGLYYGVRQDDKLVSVAGLHVFSEKFNIAAIGNIVTHADYRGKGLASVCVGSLLESLFKRVDNVALNVSPNNSAAISCYRKFGFSELHPFLEGWATLR